MKQTFFPRPPSHKTFQFNRITIDSNFDSGNLLNAECINTTNFNIWLCYDHPKNQYRTWFYFSIRGVDSNQTVTFNIKNMQNQSRLLNQGLLPVYRQSSSSQWNRINHKIDCSKILYIQGGIEWSFKHTLKSSQEHFFAFFYPWSNQDNHKFLLEVQEKCKFIPNLYFKRSNIINSLEGRPVQFITITSNKGISNKSQNLNDQHLFPNHDQPKEFILQKKGFVIGARVHPGQVPSSHVLTGIIQQLTNDNQIASLLRDHFVFYIFPIFNPDGVSRGHYRTDTNGINLNRHYINPSPKLHPSIYAVKKVILHLHEKNRYFGFLDLHAHAARKGVFIYGNATNQLQKQVQICLFPKILSLNSSIFQYEACNFTQDNMYCKDRNDNISKEGAGRVALFKATKNPYSWTLQCNYNTSRVQNIIHNSRREGQQKLIVNPNELDSKIIVPHKYPQTKEAKQFYTIDHFRKLGKEICESLLDLIEQNPNSRIDNNSSYFKSVQNVRLNLAVDLSRMAPNRFQSDYRKIYRYLQGEHESRALAALYYLLMKKAKITNLVSFIKDKNESNLVFDKSVQPLNPNKLQKIRIKKRYSTKTTKTQSNRQSNTFKQGLNDQSNSIDELPKEQTIKSLMQSQNMQVFKSNNCQHHYKRMNGILPKTSLRFCNQVKFFRKPLHSSKRIHLKSEAQKQRKNPSFNTNQVIYVNKHAQYPQIALKGINMEFK